MRKKLFFPNHILISDSFNNLGLAYKFVGELEQTSHCYESALRIREQTLDKEHPALAGMLSNLGVLYMDLAELQKAKDLFHKALQTRIKVLGLNHCKVGDCFLNLGLVHERCNENDAAARHFKRAVDIYGLAYPSGHTLYQSAVEGLARVSQDNELFDPPSASSRSAIRFEYTQGYNKKERAKCLIS